MTVFLYPALRAIVQILAAVYVGGNIGYAFLVWLYKLCTACRSSGRLLSPGRIACRDPSFCNISYVDCSAFCRLSVWCSEVCSMKLNISGRKGSCWLSQHRYSMECSGVFWGLGNRFFAKLHTIVVCCAGG